MNEETCFSSVVVGGGLEVIVEWDVDVEGNKESRKFHRALEPL